MAKLLVANSRLCCHCSDLPGPPFWVLTFVKIYLKILSKRKTKNRAAKLDKKMREAKGKKRLRKKNRNRMEKR